MADRFGGLECWVGSGAEWDPLSPNDSKPFKIACDYFVGEGLLLLRTPDYPQGDAYQDTVFGGGRRRTFELQIKGRFLRRPDGPLYVGGELMSEAIQLSGPAKLLARGALGFVKAIVGQSISYSFGEPPHILPHITAPLFSSMPVIHFCSDSSLGDALEESAASRRNRAANWEQCSARAFDSGTTITMALNTAVVDVRHWKATLPGIVPFDLHRLWGDNAVVVCIYAARDERHADKTYMVRILMRHRDETIDDAHETLSIDEDEGSTEHEARIVRPPPPRQYVTPTESNGCGRGLFVANKMDAIVAEFLFQPQSRPQDNTPRCDGWVTVVDSFDKRRRDYFAIVVGKRYYLRRRKGKQLASQRVIELTAKMSLNERRRRRIEATLHALAAQSQDALQRWLGKDSSADSHFASPHKFAVRLGPEVVTSGPVLRCSSRHAWHEEVLKLSHSGELHFVGPNDRERERLSLSCLVQPASPTEWHTVLLGEYSHFGSFELVFSDRVWIVAAPADTIPRWIVCIERLRPSAASNGTSSPCFTECDDWDPPGRRVLNVNHPFIVPPCANEDATFVAASVLRAAYATRERPAFLHAAACLRSLDSASLNLADWLNLYHALLAHANFVFGLPTDERSFARRFDLTSWEIGFEAWSLADIERIVLGSDVALCRPGRQRYRGDPRLLFALNPGTFSTPASVPVFMPEKLDTQLDAAARLALQAASQLTDQVLLPRICAWHDVQFHDLLPFLTFTGPSPEKGAATHVGYLDFSFACRCLLLTAEKDLQEVS